MARSPRVGDTYRAARRNGSGALPTKSPVLAADVKHQPVPFRPWMPKRDRQKATAALSAQRSAMKQAMAAIGNFRPSSNRSMPGAGAVRLSIWSGFKKLRRAANRGKFIPREPTLAEKRAHAWYRKIEHRFGRLVPGFGGIR